MPQSPFYNFSFTAASLRPELMAAVGEHFLQADSWAAAKTAVLASNAVQSRSSTSSVRMEREIRKRLQALTSDQLRMVVTSTNDVRTTLTWLAVVKRSAFLFDFASEVLRSKLQQHEPILRVSDYERFIDEKAPQHPQLSKLTKTSTAKIRRVLLLMLREAGLLASGSDLGTIHRPTLPPEIENIIRSDNAKWLAAFLFPDAEIRTSRSARV